MKTKSTQNQLCTGTVRPGSVLAAAAAIVIAGSIHAIAQAPSDPHHPGTSAQQTAPAQGMPQGGMMGMMQSGGMMGGMMQGGGMMGGMMGGMQGGGMMGMRNCPMMGGAAAHAEGRIAFLKAELAVTDQQKGAWDAHAAAVKKNLEGMQAMRETMMKVMQAKSPVERLDARITAMEGRLGALKEMKPALTNLYAALSDDQKKKADELMTGMGCMM